MEKWDIYNHQRVLTGKTVSRNDVMAGMALADGEFRLVCHIVVFNANNES